MRVIFFQEQKIIQNLNKNNNKGQSTIEFILSFTSAVGFVFLFLKMALNYTNGFMVHHATFMASRAYLVGDSESYGDGGVGGDAAAFKFAKTIFSKNLPEPLIPNFNGSFDIKNPGGENSVFIGGFVKFSQVFTLGFIGGKDSLEFRSESFLGREPTRGETIVQICSAIKSVTGGGSCDLQATLDDNGG